jgi:hypothetical protein
MTAAQKTVSQEPKADLNGVTWGGFDKGLGSFFLTKFNWHGTFHSFLRFLGLQRFISCKMVLGTKGKDRGNAWNRITWSIW